MLNFNVVVDIKEQHIFVEYLINKCYPCIDYSMASHRLSAFRNLNHSLGMVNGDNSPKRSSKHNIRPDTRGEGVIMSWIIVVNSVKCPQPCI